jgi:hypothetical protein
MLDHTESAVRAANLRRFMSRPIEPPAPREDNTYLHLREVTERDEAKDRESAPVTAEAAQLTFWDLFLGAVVGVITACGLAAIYFH